MGMDDHGKQETLTALTVHTLFINIYNQRCSTGAHQDTIVTTNGLARPVVVDVSMAVGKVAAGARRDHGRPERLLMTRRTGQLLGMLMLMLFLSGCLLTGGDDGGKPKVWTGNVARCRRRPARHHPKGDSSQTVH